MQKGFTLLELLVVLVVIAMSASFAAPNLWHAYTSASERSSVQTFADTLAQRRQGAFHQGKAVRLPAVTGGRIKKDGALPALPDGWELEKSTSLRFLPSGVTNGGTFYLRSPVGNRWQLTLAPLDGQVGISRL